MPLCSIYSLWRLPSRRRFVPLVDKHQPTTGSFDAKTAFSTRISVLTARSLRISWTPCIGSRNGTANSIGITVSISSGSSARSVTPVNHALRVQDFALMMMSYPSQLSKFVLHSEESELLPMRPLTQNQVEKMYNRIQCYIYCMQAIFLFILFDVETLTCFTHISISLQWIELLAKNSY